MKREIALLFAGALLGLAIEPLPVKTGQLANGMKVIVEEDRDLPNVAMYLFYKIGSRNEVPGKTGLAHFFEHMMFNGAKKFGPKMFDIVMEKNGGQNNAYTSTDLTVYTNFIPSSALEVTFELEADRIQNLAFDPKVIDSERGVVYSERRLRVDNSNFGTLFEQLAAAAFTAHPYQWSVIGWPSDIEGWSMEDLKAHFSMGYAPNNCTLVVSGAASFDQVMALAKKHLEPIPTRTPPPVVKTKEPEQKGERRVKIEKYAQLPVLMIGYHVGSSMDPDFAALAVLDAILTAERSGRLTKRMVDNDQLAVQVGAQNPMLMDPGLFTFVVQPRSGVAPEKAEAALYDEIEKLKKTPVQDKELEKARNVILGNFYQQLKTIAGKANLLGQYDIYFGGYNALFSYDQRIAAVTAADVQRVAAKYFKEQNRTVATLVPVNDRAKQGTN